jgi:Icc-related predicted phosphoesterase
MKLLLFSDLHLDVAAARRLVDASRSVDVVIGAGDFGSMRHGVDACINVLRAIDRPTVVVPGNNESLDELASACRAWPSVHVLHGSGVEIEGVPFFGLGGGVPVTPFGAWSYDFTEYEAANLLAGCAGGCVLVSHSPPKGAVDVATNGKSIGSTAVRDAIARVRPRLVVCGHVHACGGQRGAIGDAPVVNAGPAGIVWDLDLP